MEARLLIACPDRHGIVAAVSGFLAARDANIVTSDQYSTDPEGGAFFMRMAFTIEALGEDFARAFATRGGRAASRWSGAWTTPGAPSASRCSSRARTTACWTCSGAGGAASCTARSRS